MGIVLYVFFWKCLINVLIIEINADAWLVFRSKEDILFNEESKQYGTTYNIILELYQVFGS